MHAGRGVMRSAWLAIGYVVGPLKSQILLHANYYTIYAPTDILQKCIKHLILIHTNSKSKHYSQV